MNQKRLRAGVTDRRQSASRQDRNDPHVASTDAKLQPSSLLAGTSLFFLATLLVISAMRPADSVGVLDGEALVLLPLAAMAWLFRGLADCFMRSGTGPATRMAGAGMDWVDVLFVGSVIALILWIGWSGWQLHGIGNLRHALNQWWWWVTAGCVFFAVRRIVVWPGVARQLLWLVAALAIGQSVYGWHQTLVSFPADRARFAADPEGVMREAGTPAEVGSPVWELFRARLEDAGPTGTFPLANSLAGYLLLGLLIVTGIGLASRPRIDLKFAIPLLMALVIMAPIFISTESRGGYGALGFAAGVLGLGSLWQRYASRRGELREGWNRKFWRSARWSGWIVLGGMVATVILLGRVTAWWGLLPRTLVFRGQYWRATLAMVTDRPWLGAGPGNFQDRYLNYRLEDASESVLDPHNWIMETLAEGGVPALICLSVALVTGIWLACRHGEREAVASQIGQGQDGRGQDEQGQDEQRTSRGAGLALGSGAVVGFCGVSGYWAMRGELAVDPLLLSLVAATGWLMWVRFAAASQAWTAVGQRWLAIAATSGLLVHWLVAGGWTVPGLVVPWLVVAAIATADHAARQQEGKSAGGEREKKAALVCGLRCGLALLLLGGWWFTAWQPTNVAMQASYEADEYYRRGELARAFQAMQGAVTADPWAATPALRATELGLWQYLAGVGSEESWRQSQAEVLRRAPRTPWVHRELARQELLNFQRFGETGDLLRCMERLEQASALSPTDVGQQAQQAVVLLALGKREQAEVVWQRAAHLAEAGGHQERSLDRVRVLVPAVIGEDLLQQGPRDAIAAEAWRTGLAAGT